MRKMLTIGWMTMALVGFARADLWEDLATYEYGAENNAAGKLEELVKETAPDQYAEIEGKLIAIVASKTSTSAGKEWACRMLQRVGTDKAVPALSGLLKDDLLSHNACLALEMMKGSKVAKAALMKAIDGASDKVLLHVIYSLGEHRETAAVKGIAKSLTSSNPKVAAAAMMALGKIANNDALKALEGAKASGELVAKHYDALTACAANMSDKKTGAKVALDMVKSDADERYRVAALYALASADLGLAADAIEEILGGEAFHLKEGALGLIATVPGKELTQSLLEALSGFDATTQAQVVLLLGKRGDQTALKQLVGYLGSEDTGLRNAAISAVGDLGGAKEVGALLERVVAGDTSASLALVRLHDDGVNQVLADRLTDAKLSAAAMKALSDRDGRSAAPTLIKLATHKDATIRASAWGAIGQLASEKDIRSVMEILVVTSDKADKAAAQKALKRICSEAANRNAAFDAIAGSYEKSDDANKQFILELASAIGTSSALELERQALKSGNEDIRKTAIRALAAWPSIEAAPDLKTLAETGDSASTKILATRGYIQVVGKERNETKRLKMFEEAKSLVTRPDEKRLLVSGVRNVKQKQALMVLEGYLADPEVKNEAEVAAVDLAWDLRKKFKKECRTLADKLVATSENKSVVNKAKRVVKEAQ